LAKESPILKFFSEYASVPFGEIGLMIFFGLSIIVGAMILSKGHLMKLLIKQFLTLMMLVSAILNFPIIDGEPMKYEKL
jgi:1,4-dihydroxy-2-naphthoate octaprenyltransferase